MARYNGTVNGKHRTRKETVMTSLNFFYGRVSTKGQNIDRQSVMADELGIPQENRYMETANGSVRHRPQLDALLKVARKDDVVYVESMSRISRRLTDMVEICELLNDKGVRLVSLKENEIDCNTPNGRLLLGIYASLAQWEKETLALRRDEGQRVKREKTGRCGGRTPIAPEKMQAAIKLWQGREMSIKDIESATGVCKSSLYRYIEANGLTRD